MAYNLLLDSMKKIQQDYLRLLKSYESFGDDDVFFVYDEFRTFWLRHKREVEFFLNHLPSDLDTCVFIGGAYLDVESKAHIPFLAFGKKHIIDDPIYILSFNRSDSKSYCAQLLKKSIEDNISIVSKYSDVFYILPLSFLFVDKDFRSSFAQQEFLRILKNNKMTIKSYLETCVSWDDVKKQIDENAVKELLEEYEGESFEDRYFKHLEKIHIDFDKEKPALQFLQMCLGIFTQVATVLDFCNHYGTFPFIRNRTLFYSFVSLESNFIYEKNDLFSKRMLLKALLSHATNCIMDWQTQDVNEPQFIKMIEGFEKDVMNQFPCDAIEGESADYSVERIRAVLTDEMKKRGIPYLF
jgi:hypothetical protein